jgi:hypothetical protein
LVSIGRQIARRQREADEFERGWNVGVVLGFRPGLGAASAFAVALAAMVAIAAAGEGQDGASFAKAPVKFDIPAQPLSDALYSYSSVTGIEILIPGEMLARRRSSGVTGVLLPDEALRILLAGTGLVPRATGVRAFTLLPDAANATSTAAHIPRYPQYSAAIQAAVTSALCRLRETRPGGYRIAARLWVGPSGAVTRVGFLGTTGDADRDAVLAGLLGRLVVSEPPPADLPQPTTVVVLPRQENAADCRADGAGAAP